MLGDILRKGLVGEEMQGQMPMQMPIGLSGALMAGAQPMPQQADMFGQYNNPMMFLRRF